MSFGEKSGFGKSLYTPKLFHVVGPYLHEKKFEPAIYSSEFFALDRKLWNEPFYTKNI